MVKMKVSQKPTSNEQTRPTKKTKRDQSMERPKESLKPTFREIEEACKEDNLKVIKEIVKNHGHTWAGGWGGGGDDPTLKKFFSSTPAVNQLRGGMTPGKVLLHG